MGSRCNLLRRLFISVIISNDSYKDFFDKINGTRMEYEVKSYRKATEKCKILCKTYSGEDFVSSIIFLENAIFALKPLNLSLTKIYFLLKIIQ